jgi:hypothetical protein
MMTNAPDDAFALRTFEESGHDVQRPGVLERFLRKIQVAVCSLHGHDSVLQFEGTRMFLLCTSCGSETPGWDISPGPDFERRRAVVRPALNATGSLSVVRKVA